METVSTACAVYSCKQRGTRAFELPPQAHFRARIARVLSGSVSPVGPPHSRPSPPPFSAAISATSTEAMEVVKPSAAWRRRWHAGCSSGNCKCVPPLSVLAVEELCVRGEATRDLQAMLPRWPVSNREVLSVIESYRGCNSLRPVDYWVQRLSGPFAPVHLDLQRTNFCGLEGSLDSLSKLGSLQALNISKTGISDDAFISLCRGMTGLKSLSIAACPLSRNALVGLRMLKGLRYLDARNDGLPLLGLQALCLSNGVKHVRLLDSYVSALEWALKLGSTKPELATLTEDTVRALTVPEICEYLRVLEEPLPRGKDEMINRLLVALQHFRNSSAFSNLLLLCPFEEDEYLVLPDIPILSEPMPDAVIASTAEESPFVIKKRPRLVEPLSEPCMDSGEPPSTPRGTPPSGSPRLVHFSPDRILKRYGGSLKKSPSEPVRRAGPQRKLREIQLQFESLRFKHSKNYRTLLEACVPFLTESLSQFEGVTLGREDATELQTLIATRDRLAKQLDAMLTPA